MRDGDLLIPIPLHPSRERDRGYNQSAVLASELAYLMPLDIARGALSRTRATADQVTLSHEQREANVRGAFAADPPAVCDRRVWLLDDVYTTGSTLRSAAQALRSAGAREVRGAVVALARGSG
jgi:ComF family protein